MITRLAAPMAATVAVALAAVGVASAASLHVSEEPVLANIAVVFQDCDAAAPTHADAIVVAGPGCADGEAPGTALGLSDDAGGPGAPIDVPAPSPTPSAPAPAPGQAPPTPGPTPPTPASGSPTPGTPAPTATADPAPTATADPAPSTAADPAPSTTADPAPSEPDPASSAPEGDGV